MTRIEIVYDGHPYSTADADLDELKARVLDASVTGVSFWLTVNEGAGSLRATDLLINGSSQISLTAIESD